jgi:hypothetical protein
LIFFILLYSCIFEANIWFKYCLWKNPTNITRHKH